MTNEDRRALGWPTGRMSLTNYTTADVLFWRDMVARLRERHGTGGADGDVFDAGYQYGVRVGGKAARFRSAARPTIDEIERAVQ